MVPKRKILLTGCAGYLGSVMTRYLLECGHTVFGVDLLIFGDRGITGLKGETSFHFRKGDVRKRGSYQDLLSQVDAVIHLAAISGMPSCDKFPVMAREINWEATKTLFDCVNEHESIMNLVFASTTSIFGATKTGETVDEASPPNPLSLYAETKLQSEQYMIQSSKRESLTVTPLRFPTAFGLSPRMRFDLTVNEFTRDLSLGRELKIFGEEFWRPYCHVHDLSRACEYMMHSPSEKVDREVYCVGDANQNYTKRMIYEALLELIPQAKISLIPKVSDRRDYRVDFSKIKRIGFEITKSVKDGIREIHLSLKKGEMKNPDDVSYTSLLPEEIG